MIAAGSGGPGLRWPSPSRVPPTPFLLGEQISSLIDCTMVAKMQQMVNGHITRLGGGGRSFGGSFPI